MTVTLRAPEVRTYASLEIRAIETNGSLTELEGQAVPYGEWANIGWFAESHAAGVFDKSIKEAARELPLLLWHDNRTWPIGKAAEWRSTVEGLIGVWSLDSSAEAQRGAQLARDGFLTGLSVGFVPIQSAWEYADDWNPDLGIDHMDKVTRTEARLVEVSLTPTPAFAGAEVTLVRSTSRREIQRPPKVSREIAEWRSYLKSAQRG